MDSSDYITRSEFNEVVSSLDKRIDDLTKYMIDINSKLNTLHKKILEMQISYSVKQNEIIELVDKVNSSISEKDGLRRRIIDSSVTGVIITVVIVLFKVVGWI